MALGGLPPSSAVFADFREMGQGADVRSSTTPSGVWSIHDSPPTVFSDEFSSVPRNRPPVVSTGDPVLPSSDVFVIEDAVDPPAPVRRARPTLDPRQVISTRTRRGTAAAAGVPRPAVDYFPAPDDTPAPAPPSATSVRRSRRTTPTPDPVTPEPLIDAPTIPIGSSEPSPTPPSGPLLGSNPSSDSRPSIDDSALASAELDFRESVERYSHADWAREQRNEPVCDAAIRYLILGEPPVLPPGFLDSYPAAHRPSFSDIRDLAHKGRLHLDDEAVVLLVRKPTKIPPVVPSRPSGRAARLLNDEPVRIYVPMLMRPWIMQACHANTSCHLGATRTLRMLERFYWWVGMEVSTRWWIRHCLRCQARKSSRQTARWPILCLPLPSGPGVSISVDYFGPLPTTPRGNTYILLFTDRFSRRADMYAVTAAEFTAEGTADILVNRFIPLWGCPISLLSDNGLHFCSKLSQAIYKRLGVRKVATSSYHPNGNGGVERVNHTMAQMLAMVVNERQDDWDIHLPHVESAYNNSVSEATGLAPNEVHMNRLPRLPLTVLEHPYARGHQSLDRDQLEYCDLAADRQRRAYELVREQHQLRVSRTERRNSVLSNALQKLPVYAIGGWVWVYNSESTIRQGVRSGTNDKVLKAKLSLLWTGPFKILAVGPCTEAPDGRPLASKLLYLDLPTDLPGKDSKRRVSVARCKPCANPHDTNDLPRFLPAGLTPYVLNNYTTKSPPYHVTVDDVSTPVERLEVEQISTHQLVRGRGGVIAVLYETHWKGLLRPSWEREMDLQHSRQHILRYWQGLPDQQRSTNRRYRAMRVGSAMRELARAKGHRYVPSGYALISRSTWGRRLANSPLPVGAFFWYKANHGLWWLGKISGHTSQPPLYLVRLLDDPGPIKIALSDSRYTTAADAVQGSWCLQVHRGSALLKGILRNVDMSREDIGVGTPSDDPSA